MKKGVMIGLVVAGILILLIIGFFVLSNRGSEPVSNSQNENVDADQMVDCGTMNNPSCFQNRMLKCLPVTGTMMGSDGVTPIELIILGVENDTCHFQRKINNVMDMDCYFPKGTENWNNLGDLLGQTLGDDKGLQSVVDESCEHI